ncbi:MAG: four helix bundle protein [Patescibacteria group bacterium]|nr:four helix bundle protein [Patescibacteria group bacterium]
MNQGGKIKSFTDLIAWREGHKLVLVIYDITKQFPKDELFGLVSQIRRCVVSITSNIAEGFSRLSYKDKARFYSISLGSTTELQNQLLIAKDVNYISKKEFQNIAEQSVKVHKIINGLIKSSKIFNN